MNTPVVRKSAALQSLPNLVWLDCTWRSLQHEVTVTNASSVGVYTSKNFRLPSQVPWRHYEGLFSVLPFFMGTMAFQFHSITTFHVIDAKQSFSKWWQISVPNVKKIRADYCPLIINYMTNYLLAFSFLTGVFLASTFRDKSRLSILWKWEIIFFLGNVFVLPTPVLISGRKYSSYTYSSRFIEKYIDFKRVSCMYWHNCKKILTLWAKTIPFSNYWTLSSRISFKHRTSEQMASIFHVKLLTQSLSAWFLCLAMVVFPLDPWFFWLPNLKPFTNWNEKRRGLSKPMGKK